MKSKLAALGAAVALLAPGSASAFSFGAFLAGERITSIELAGIDVTYTSGSGALVVTGWVSEINTNYGNTLTPGIGEVIFDSQLTMQSEFNLPGSFVTAVFDSATADMSILDTGTGGAGLIYEADFDASGLGFSAQEVSGVVTGSLAGVFDTRPGSNADFETAMGDVGNILVNLGNFVSNGTPVSTIDDLIQAGCIPFVFCTVDNFTASATGNIDPPAAPAPEPGALLLLGSGLVGLAVRSRRA